MEPRPVEDPYLEGFLTKYDQWIGEGKITHAARVIPIAESLHAQQWVMPTEQVMAILRGADSVALWNCVCRSHYHRCDNPLEVCFILNRMADALVAKGLARSVSQEEWAEVLRKANAHGLVHLGLYMPGQDPAGQDLVGLCSCCSCCCHELQILQQLGRRDRLARSEFVAVTDPGDCTHCGACLERCRFEARALRDGRLEYQMEACLGCGLCVTTCPPGATVMEPRADRAPAGGVPER